MCGIFGGVIGAGSTLRTAPELERCMRELFSLSESRGKEAAGLALATADELATYKAALPARSMIRASSYRALLRDVAARPGASSLAFIGHSRLVTDGGREQNRNNQPVTVGGIAGILLGFLLAQLIATVSPLPARLEPWSIFLGVGITAAVGLFFGVYPASRAANLDPIEALRRE